MEEPKEIQFSFKEVVKFEKIMFGLSVTKTGCFWANVSRSSTPTVAVEDGEVKSNLLQFTSTR